MIAADAAVVDKLTSLAAVQEITLPETLSLDGKEHRFSTKSLYEIIPAAPPAVPSISVRSLDGFGTLIRQKVDAKAFNYEDAVIQVIDHQSVALLAKTTDQYGRRQTLLTVKPVDFKQFTFDSWTKQDVFVISVAALFSDTPDRNYVIKIAGSLTSSNASISEVDAFTQRVTVKAGLSVPETINIRPVVKLAPYRTFPECRQPISEFIFRAQVAEDSMPQLKLVEADGGKWKVDAMSEIRRYLAVLDLGIEIVA